MSNTKFQFLMECFCMARQVVAKLSLLKKFAEEINYNYVELKPSDLASIYVHGTQEKIAKLFNDAKENAQQ